MRIFKATVRLISFIGVILCLQCSKSYTPKPRGYPKLDFPDKEFILFDSTFPYSFEYPVYVNIVAENKELSEPYWINLEFPDFDGKIHISYKAVRNDLDDYVEDSRNLAYKHTIKADAIKETVYSQPETRVYGVLYDIKGNAASSVQFFLTDSNKHFLRGSLYFNVEPDKDSLAPVIDFVREDIIHFIESFHWNN